MARPQCCRRVVHQPRNTRFFPQGVDSCDNEAVVLGMDELEAVRLADLEGLYHEEAGKHMGVSRPTFSRILRAAHKKIAQVLVDGKALHIEGGTIAAAHPKPGRCEHCTCKLDPGNHCPLCNKSKTSKTGSNNEQPK